MGRIFGTPVSQEELEALVKELGPPTTSSSTRAWTLTMEELEAKVAYLEAQAKKPNLCWHERIELRNHDVNLYRRVLKIRQNLDGPCRDDLEKYLADDLPGEIYDDIVARMTGTAELASTAENN